MFSNETAQEALLKATGIHLIWIVVKDFDSALTFYTETFGFTITSLSKEFGWAELSGPEGCLLGIARENEHYGAKAGANAVPTMTVDDIETARNKLLQIGVTLVGKVMEVPGHVKLQTFTDQDGNTFQLCQSLEK